MREEGLSLEKCLRICRDPELAGNQVQTLEERKVVDAVKFTKSQVGKNFTKQNNAVYGNQKNHNQRIQENVTASNMASFNSKNKENNYDTKNHRINYQSSSTCSRCGYRHQPRNCPAFGKTCKKCIKQNHFAQICRNNHVVNVIQTNSETKFNVD